MTSGSTSSRRCVISGLSQAEIHVLGYLAEAGPVDRRTTSTASFGHRRSTLSSVLNRLESTGARLAIDQPGLTAARSSSRPRMTVRSPRCEFETRSRTWSDAWPTRRHPSSGKASVRFWRRSVAKRRPADWSPRLAATPGPTERGTHREGTASGSLMFFSGSMPPMPRLTQFTLAGHSIGPIGASLGERPRHQSTGDVPARPGPGMRPLAPTISTTRSSRRAASPCATS